MDNANVIDSTAVPVNNIGLGSVLRIPAVKQIMLLVGVAAAVAAGLAVFLWSQNPTMTPIYPGGDMAEASEISSALRSAGIDHEVNPVNGSVLVDGSRYMEARMMMADGGLGGEQNELLELDGSMGRTAAMEARLLQQQQEVELAKTISALTFIRSARVHLATPVRTAFIRPNTPATASVMLAVAPGRSISSKQAASIAQMVARAVENLDPSDVTVTDQHGRTLSAGDGSSNEALASSQLEHQMKIERNLKQKLEELFTPVVGFGRVRAQVSADIDFSHREVATEAYDGDNTAVVSRQVSENSVSGADAAPGGVPGTPTNTPEENGGQPPTEAEQVAVRNQSSTRSENFEVPRTVTYERPQPATISRLSVAILIDDSPLDGAGDDAAPAGLTPAQIAQYEELARGVVGFDEARGDTLVVQNTPFLDRVEIEPIEPPAIWEKPLVRDIAKQVLGVALVLAIVFGVVRPMLRNVVAAHAESNAMRAGYPAAAAPGQPAVAIPAPSFDEKVAAARNISGNDPARVAQVVKQWVGDNG